MSGSPFHSSLGFKIRGRLVTRHSSLVTSLKMALPHFYALVLFSFLVSVVFGAIAKDTPRDRLVYGAKSFGLFVGVAVLIGWIMYFLPR